MSTIIGIDHGNGLIKTAHSQFSTGIAEYYDAPPIETPYTIRIGSMYYACNSGRGRLQLNKTEKETYWYLTLAGIGAELRHRGITTPIGTREEIILAAGLPLTYPKDDRLRMRDYLKRGETNFWFDGHYYRINIKNVMIFPQGYSAIMSRIKELSKEAEVNVIDIGSWTVDAITIIRGVPNLDRARSFEYGVIRGFDEIIEKVRRNTKKSIGQEQIEAVLWPQEGIGGLIPAEVRNEIKKEAQRYVANLIDMLTEGGFYASSVPTVFIGGGAFLVKELYEQKSFLYPMYIEDVKANAEGYEIMVAAARQKKKR